MLEIIFWDKLFPSKLISIQNVKQTYCINDIGNNKHRKQENLLRNYSSKKFFCGNEDTQENDFFVANVSLENTLAIRAETFVVEFLTRYSLLFYSKNIFAIDYCFQIDYCFIDCCFY